MKEIICTGYESRYDITYAGIPNCTCGKPCVYWSYDGCAKKYNPKPKHERTKKELDDFLQKKYGIAGRK